MDLLHIQYTDLISHWRHSKTRMTKRALTNQCQHQYQLIEYRYRKVTMFFNKVGWHKVKFQKSNKKQHSRTQESNPEDWENRWSNIRTQNTSNGRDDNRKIMTLLFPAFLYVRNISLLIKHQDRFVTQKIQFKLKENVNLYNTAFSQCQFL